MKILIVTGIYPPEIGGPAEYAKNLKDIWTAQGHKVSVKIFSRFQKIPWGIRHIVFFFYILPSVASADNILTLDAFSAGVVVVASKLFAKGVIFRTGGDVLWELYVDRTNDLVLLRDFYLTRMTELSLKEKIIFHLMKWALQNLSAIVWSTNWQREIFMRPYGLESQKHYVVENYYGSKLPRYEPESRDFLGATRKRKWKNVELVERVFQRIDVSQSGAVLDTAAVPHVEFLNKISHCYSVIIASLGDISPNTILDAIRHDKPFIITRETGLADRIKDCALFVDPQNENDIADKVIWLSDEKNYKNQQKKVNDFIFTHTWEQIAQEYLDVFHALLNDPKQPAYGEIGKV
ncbi:MAG: hypothetical protein Q8O98_02050 [bacterium]|nr:hypothetical protein [bacterium]